MIRIVRKYPVAFSIIVFAFTMLIPWGALYPLLSKLPYYWGFFVKYMLTFVLSIGLTLLIYKKIPFSLKNPSYIKGLFTFGFFGIVCAFIAFFSSMQKIDRTTNFLEIFSFVLYIIAVVLSEEFLFRII